MKTMIRRNFRILCDFTDIRNFMVELYEKDWRNGVPAPFLEYALSSSWMDTSYTHKFQIWEEDNKIVALVFYENPISDTYFSLRPGYEFLADEMVAYAETDMPKKDGKQKLVIFQGQKAVLEAAERAGYAQTGGWNEMIYEFENSLDFSLPEGFHFVAAEKMDVRKIEECCWKGFGREEEEGPYNGDGEDFRHNILTPNATPLYSVAIANDTDEYACFAGMWWTPENKLAYMEPLCTVPQYRHLGLASAALSELYHRMKPLGATHMTGGGDPFYARIGFQPCIGWTFWEKKDNLKDFV